MRGFREQTAELYCSLADKTGIDFKAEQKMSKHFVARNLRSVHITLKAIPHILLWRDSKQ